MWTSVLRMDRRTDCCPKGGWVDGWTDGWDSPRSRAQLLSIPQRRPADLEPTLLTSYGVPCLGLAQFQTAGRPPGKGDCQSRPWWLGTQSFGPQHQARPTGPKATAAHGEGVTGLASLPSGCPPTSPGPEPTRPAPPPGGAAAVGLWRCEGPWQGPSGPKPASAIPSPELTRHLLPDRNVKAPRSAHPNHCSIACTKKATPKGFCR